MAFLSGKILLVNLKKTKFIETPYCLFLSILFLLKIIFSEGLEVQRYNLSKIKGLLTVYPTFEPKSIQFQAQRIIHVV